MGATRVEERLLCAFGLVKEAPLRFESCEALAFGGVLFLLPFLLECGLLSYQNHYSQRTSGYYSFSNLFILIAFLYLCRIKSFEATKHYSPGEFGKLIGYDRIPEVKTLRGMIAEITAQRHTDEWMAALSQSWIDNDQPELYYIDGHVQVYHGYLANLGKKYVSRQRLCLPGVMDFWVNASDGNPYFFVTAEVNEKMGEILINKIVPELLKLHPVSPEHQERMDSCEDEPIFTLVFDREAYSPALFAELWDKYRIAVISYRKNVKDRWDDNLFTDYEVITTLGETTMQLHEQEFCHEKCTMREVRKLSKDGHQTSIVTTNKVLLIVMIASYMFARWIQENFFRYMRQEYALDKIIQYSTDEINKDIKVVNREYSNICSQIKKARENLNRKQNKLYEHEQQNPLQRTESENGKWLKTQLELIEDIELINRRINDLVDQRKKIPYKIPLSQMPEDIRYNRLNIESRVLQNIIKMICYRAETALTRLLSPHYKRANQEIRALVKSIIHTRINMNVDHENQVLNITLYALANQRSNEAVHKICDTVNDTNTLFPGTNLRLVFKIATS
jgi:pyruvate-formate lyase-activating enzyme